jgi:hypothetical protein
MNYKKTLYGKKLLGDQFLSFMTYYNTKTERDERKTKSIAECA